MSTIKILLVWAAVLALALVFVPALRGHQAENDHTHEMIALLAEIRDLSLENKETNIANAEANRRIQLFTFYRYLAEGFDPPGVPAESVDSTVDSCNILHPCDFIRAVGATEADLALVGCQSDE
jgi:hypothetical protein